MNKNIKKRLMSLGVAATLAATAPAVSKLVETNNESYEPNVKIEETNVGVIKPLVTRRPNRTLPTQTPSPTSAPTQKPTRKPVQIPNGAIRINTPVPTQEPCKHNGISYWVAGYEATCTEGGYSGHWVCGDCGEIISRAYYTQPLGHDPISRGTIPSTCTEHGIKNKVTCARCGEVLEKEEILPLAPHREAYLNGKASTCTTHGYTETKFCLDCGKTLIESKELPLAPHILIDEFGNKIQALDNTVVEHDAKCINCGKEFIGEEYKPVENTVFLESELVLYRRITLSEYLGSDNELVKLCDEAYEKMLLFLDNINDEEIYFDYVMTLEKINDMVYKIINNSDNIELIKILQEQEKVFADKLQKVSSRQIEYDYEELANQIIEYYEELNAKKLVK